MTLILLMAVMAMIIPQNTWAVSPHPDREAEMQALRAFGQPAVDFQKLQMRWSAMGIDQPGRFSLASLAPAATDTLNILTILIQYPDEAAVTASEFFDTLIYADQQGTVYHYYDEVSYGTLCLTTVVLCSDIGWLTSSQNSSYYTSGGDYGLNYNYPNNAQKLVEEAVDQADAYIDYGDFDNDGDNYMDVLMVVHAGQGAEYTSDPEDIWSHKWGITTRWRDGIGISEYCMMPEYFLTSGDMTCGVYVHELGHIFGLPDLYDRDYSSRGVGNWSVMASGSWNGFNGDSPAHFDAWSKFELGFLIVSNVMTTLTDISIPAVENDPTVFRLWTSGAIGDEYFLVENRQQIGYDAALPGAGLLIWHIDDQMGEGADPPDNDDEWYPGCVSCSGHYLVALEPADSLWELERKLDYGDAGDPFPGTRGNRTFSPLTKPNSNSYSDDNTLVAVTNISDSDDTMTADFTVSFASGLGDDEGTLPIAFELAQNSPNPFTAQTRISFVLQEEGPISLEVFNLLGQKVKTLQDGYLQAGEYESGWDGCDDNGKALSSGIYFYRLVSGDGLECKKMLLLK